MILSRLKLRPMRYGELRQDLPALSDKVLTERLRDLCEAGFVKQERSNGASRYCLTRRGEMLKPILQALYDWGHDNAASFGVRFPNSESEKLESLYPAAVAAARLGPGMAAGKPAADRVALDLK